MRALLSTLLMAFAIALLTPLPAARAQRDRQHRIAQARELFTEGVAAYERNELDVAVHKLLAAQRAWRSPEIAFNIARCFERMGDARRGIHWFRVYLRHGRPDESTRADVNHRIAELRALAERQQAQNQTTGANAAELTAESRRLYQQGVAFYGRGEYRTAYELFQNACNVLSVAQESEYGECADADLSYNLARTAERLELWGDARLHYRKFLRLRPRSPERRRIERRMEELRNM